MPLVAAVSDTQVIVDWFYDSGLVGAGGGGVPALGAAGAAASPASAGSLPAMLKEYGPQAGLGLLALVSLVMVTRWARRAQLAIEAPREAARAAEKAQKRKIDKEVEQFDMDGGPVGEALTSEAVLEGREVGEDEVRIRHIINQIGQMVKEDTVTAATLVEHWAGEGR